MQFLSVQEALTQKFRRQKKIKQLKYHALGTCAHLGKISPGCISCFRAGSYYPNVISANKCNSDCVYCTSYKDAEKLMMSGIRQTKKMLLEKFRTSKNGFPVVSFSGGGDPLFRFNILKEFVNYVHKLTKHQKRRPWLYLYTNGLLANRDMALRLRELGFSEIRFHLGASNFSKVVYNNMEVAVKYLKAVTVETPAWPPHRKQLFKMLPIIEAIGVKHLNIGEIEVNEYNLGRIIKALPNAKLYPCFQIHLYDGGLVYDIMEEVLRKNYSYSVLDCNCFVKLMQRGKANGICYDDIRGLTTIEI
jgi:pyruvate formate-lyase activating enzyme-like uncharacterized protein